MAASRMGGTEIVHMLLSLSDININHRDEVSLVYKLIFWNNSVGYLQLYIFLLALLSWVC